MKIKRSELILKDFFLLGQQIEFIDGESGYNDPVSDLFEKYNVDIDFKIENNDDRKLLYLFVRVLINVDEEIPGYRIYTECNAIYSFQDDIELTEQDKADLLFGSGLSMCINQLRSLIASATSMFPLGKYFIPSIDINQLMADKKKLMTEKKKSKKKKSKTE